MSNDFSIRVNEDGTVTTYDSDYPGSGQAQVDYGGGPGVTEWTVQVNAGGGYLIDRHINVNAGTVTLSDHSTGSVIAQYNNSGWIDYHDLRPEVVIPLLPGWIGTIISQILGQIQPVIEAALVPITTRVTNLTNLVTATIGEVKEWVVNQGQCVLNATITAYKELQRYFDTAVGKVTGAMQALYGTVSGWISAAVQAASSSLQDAVNRVQQALQAADTAIRVTIDNLWTWVLQSVNTLVGEVRKLWDALQEIVRRAEEEAEKTAKAIADLNDSLQAWVQNHIIEILLQGLDAWVVG